MDSRALRELLQRRGVGTSIACAIIAGYAWFRYHDCLLGFFYLDDFRLIERAAGLQVASPWDLGALFEPAHTGLLYRPLTQPGYFYLLRKLFAYDATAYHAFQLLVHVANGALVFAVSRRLTRSAAAGLAAAMLYMAAPGHAAAVYWLAAFTMTGTTLVVFASMWWWLRTRSIWRPVGCAILQAVGLLASEHAVVVPVLLAALALFSTPREPWRRVARHLAPTTGLAAAYLVGKLFLWASGAALGAHYHLSPNPGGWLPRIGTYAAACFRALAPIGGSDFAQAAAGAGIVGVAAFAAWRGLRNRSRWRLVALGCVIFLVSLAPVLFLRDHTYDYFIGVAAMGAALAVVGACRVASPDSRALALVLATGVVVLDASVGARALRANPHVERVVRGSYRAASWLRAIEDAASRDEKVDEILVPAVAPTLIMSRMGGSRYLLTMPRTRIGIYETPVAPDPQPGQVVLTEPRLLVAGERLPGWDPRWNWLRRAAGRPANGGG